MACFGRYRYLVLFIGFLCLFSICTNYLLINFTFICMTEDKEDVIETNEGIRHRYDYSPAEKSYIHWAVATGTIMGTFPINMAYVKWGAKFPFFVCGVLSCISTALTPISAHFGLPTFILVRLLQGLAFAADFAAVGMLTVRWSPLSETATFLAFLTSFTPVATFISNAGSGMFCSTIGWRAAFYFNAFTTFVVFILWLLIYSDDPQTHTGVEKRELEEIQRGKTKEHIERDSFVPYKSIICNRTIIVVLLNALTELVSLITVSTYAPVYFRKILSLSISSTAFWTAFAAAVHLPIKLIMAFLSDRVTYFTQIHKMIFFNTLAVGIAGVFTGFIPFSPSPSISIASYVIMYGLAGANSSGFYKCATLHSRQYAHFVLATIQFMKCTALFVGPAMYFFFMNSDEDVNGWKIIFIINAIAMLISNLLFYPVATDRPASFTSITRSPTENKIQNEKSMVTLSSNS